MKNQKKNQKRKQNQKKIQIQMIMLKKQKNQLIKRNQRRKIKVKRQNKKTSFPRQLLILYKNAKIKWMYLEKTHSGNTAPSFSETVQ